MFKPKNLSKLANVIFLKKNSSMEKYVEIREFAFLGRGYNETFNIKNVNEKLQKRKALLIL